MGTVSTQHRYGPASYIHFDNYTVQPRGQPEELYHSRQVHLRPDRLGRMMSYEHRQQMLAL